MLKQEVYDFLNSRSPKLCALATSKPGVAVMGYAVLPDLTIIMSTDKTSRKWQNLKTNDKVAIVFGWGFDELNVQYEGTAKLFENDGEFEKCKEIYFAVHPEATEFRDLPETVFMKITPTWIRLTAYSTTLPRILEEEC